jgi:hypothetical protein
MSDGSRTRLHTVTTCPRPGRVRSSRSRRLLGGRRYRHRRGGSSTSRTWFSRFSVGCYTSLAYDPGNAWSPHPDSNRHLPFTGRLLFLMSSAGLSSGGGNRTPTRPVNSRLPSHWATPECSSSNGRRRREGRAGPARGRVARRLVLEVWSRVVFLSCRTLIVLVLWSVLRGCAACCSESFRCPGARWLIGES